MRTANVEEFLLHQIRRSSEEREENKFCWYHVRCHNLVQQCRRQKPESYRKKTKLKVKVKFEATTTTTCEKISESFFWHNKYECVEESVWVAAQEAQRCYWEGIWIKCKSLAVVFKFQINLIFDEDLKIFIVDRLIFSVCNSRDADHDLFILAGEVLEVMVTGDVMDGKNR